MNRRRWLHTCWHGLTLGASIALAWTGAFGGGLRALVAHLGLHLLQYWPVRFGVRLFAGVLLSMMGVVMLLAWLVAQPIRAQDMVQVQGMVATYKHDPNGTLLIVLDGSTPPFMVAAHGAAAFNAQRFMAEVHAGDEVTLTIRRTQQQRRATEPVLVAFAVSAGNTTYLTVQQVAAANRREAEILPIMGAACLVLGALCGRTIL